MLVKLDQNQEQVWNATRALWPSCLPGDGDGDADADGDGDWDGWSLLEASVLNWEGMGGGGGGGGGSETRVGCVRCWW